MSMDFTLVKIYSNETSVDYIFELLRNLSWRQVEPRLYILKEIRFLGVTLVVCQDVDSCII